MISETHTQAEDLLRRVRLHHRQREQTYEFRYRELRRRTLFFTLAAAAIQGIRARWNLEGGGQGVWFFGVAALFTLGLLALTRVYHLEEREEMFARLQKCHRACGNP